MEETNLWKRDGHRSAASWLAATTGSSVGAAVGTLETARRVEDLPAVAEAQRAGRLSEAEAREVAAAAAVDPRAESDLLAAAGQEPVATLRQRAALEERDPTCVVEGCAVSKGLEIDHVDGWALTHTTTLERLARLCRWHHHLKTYWGYRLDGCVGDWRLLAPDHPPDDDDGGPGPPDRDRLFGEPRPGDGRARSGWAGRARRPWLNRWRTLDVGSPAELGWAPSGHE